MDRLVDEAEALGGAVHSSAIATNNRTEPIPDQQLSILNSITANDLTGKSFRKECMEKEKSSRLSCHYHT